MQFRNIVQSIVTIGIGVVVVIIAMVVVREMIIYSWEKDLENSKQELAEIVKSTERKIAEKKHLDEKTRQTFRDRERRFRIEQMLISTAFKKDRCSDFLKYLDFKDFLSLPDYLLQADLHMRGKCADQDYVKAFSIYQKKLTEIYEYDIYRDGKLLHLPEEYYGYIAHIKFRLASLYWRGQGVSEDKDKARELSKEAAIILATWHAKISQRPPDIDLGPTNVWNMSDVEILENITFHETGPWDMPEPLIQQINWLKKILKDGGKAYFEIGLHLLNGTGGYEQDPVIAYEWFYIASHYYDYGPAHYSRAMLMRDQKFYEKKNKFPFFSLEFNLLWKKNVAVNRSNNLLLRAVKAGDIRADKELLTFYQNVPAYLGQEKDIYFWMVRLYQQNDPAITEEDLQDMRKKLDKFQIEFTEDDVKENRFPHYSLRP